MTKLAEQLVALCKEHDLNCLSLDVHLFPDGTYFYGSYAHGSGEVGSASIMRGDLSGAVAEAITNLEGKRGRPLVVVPELVAA